MTFDTFLMMFKPSFRFSHFSHSISFFSFEEEEIKDAPSHILAFMTLSHGKEEEKKSPLKPEEGKERSDVTAQEGVFLDETEKKNGEKSRTFLS